MGLERVGSVARTPRGGRAGVRGDHRRRHQRQGLDGRAPGGAARRPRRAAPACSPRRTCCATTSASRSTAREVERRRADRARSSASRPRAAPPRSPSSSTTRWPRCCIFADRRRGRGGARGRPRRPARCHQPRRRRRGGAVLGRLRSSRLARRHTRADRRREGRHLSPRPPGGARQRRHAGQRVFARDAAGRGRAGGGGRARLPLAAARGDAGTIRASRSR